MRQHTGLSINSILSISEFVVFNHLEVSTLQLPEKNILMKCVSAAMFQAACSLSEERQYGDAILSAHRLRSHDKANDCIDHQYKTSNNIYVHTFTHPNAANKMYTEI